MILYAATILASSFLLFLIQPIIAKQILPWFGGTAAVWTTCLVFFQLTLLAGYLYSDLSNRLLKPKAQSALHILLLIISLAAMPIIAATGWKPVGTEDPLWRILGLLLLTIGMPYFMLSTTAPLLQSWFAREHADPNTAKRVYRFFALSNLGAMLGLLSYPFVIETWITTRNQALGWSICYAVFVALCIGSAWRARNLKIDTPTAEAFSETLGSVPQMRDYGLWFVLAALPSLMLLAVTNHITQNVASIPFMWILPLTLYLLSFVLCFEGRNFYVRKFWIWPTLVIIIAMAWGLTTNYGFLAINIAIPLYCTGLFLVCMFCHGELAAAKPVAHYLTRFYLILSLGGAAGGLFVGLIAPKIFNAFWELPLGLAALALIVWILTKKSADSHLPKIAAIASLGAISYFAYDYNQLQKMDNTIAAVRNFYGRLSVKQIGYGISDTESYRVEMHGTIQHGKQFVHPANRHFTTSYYSESSGIGMALAHIHPGQQKIGGVGMGIGTIAGHSKPGGLVKFYEVNPKVIDYAKEQFYYLSESSAKVEVELGDGRLLLERESPQQFDVLAIDAFSGDAVPVHLITREAMALYLKHVKPDGAVAFHVTSRYLNLAPVVKQLADDAGYEAVLISDKSDDIHYSPSNWVIVTHNQDFLNAPDVMQNRVAIDPIPNMKIWTDDFSNLFQVLK
ncbi:MAG: fused MFS/spermidine synthase [Gallionella sp.]|nr:fused MFS/spermidine synthase [Gallionella sp.]